ncbi:DNA lyase [Mesorhizobium sp. B4-1-4]|uniref:8-oxoguanine DNA glycosylase n=1 Tax=Mesorhizobium sp. B4-1-4 TaxID=2589888 RepID=UPI00112A925A|nr:DNA lyase [Mesorhizobium sp. B4-1-4]UCI32127.1 DNA lyase [Mesorhizobium sp. B4-1-4]
MKAFTARELTTAVCAICPEIESRIAGNSKATSERQLWWELSACLLSSQVPYVLAAEAASAIEAHGILHGGDLEGELTDQLITILRSPGGGRSYRFPVARARQLAVTKRRIADQFGTLGSLLTMSESPDAMRHWLVETAPGLGPKQASMFLRNVGVSYELAILDRHVLDYMQLIGLRTVQSRPITTMKQYERDEESMRGHARELGFPVGILDWAIWIVMRVAKRQEEAKI